MQIEFVKKVFGSDFLMEWMVQYRLIFEEGGVN
jgi:hypothetical protein